MLQRHVDSVEFSEWMEFYQMEPFGEYRDDLRAGVVASVIANVNRAKTTKPLTPADFLLKFGPVRSGDSRSLLRHIARLAGTSNGK